MPPTIGGVTIDPQGQTLTVTVTPSAKVYTDAAGTSLASFPATVTSRTSYWVSSAQQFTISVKSPQGVEIADGVGNPLVLDIQQGVMEGIAPVVDRPGPEDQAQSGTYAPRRVLTSASNFPAISVINGARYIGYDDVLGQAWYADTTNIYLSPTNASPPGASGSFTSGKGLPTGVTNGFSITRIVRAQLSGDSTPQWYCVATEQASGLRKVYKAAVATGNTALTWTAVKTLATNADALSGCVGVSPDGGTLLVAEYAVAGGTVTGGPSIYRSTDGSTFPTVYGPITITAAKHFHGVWFDPYDTNVAYALLGDGTATPLIKSTDAGITWTAVGTVPIGWDAVQMSFHPDCIVVTGDSAVAPFYILKRGELIPKTPTRDTPKNHGVYNPGGYQCVTFASSTTMTQGTAPNFEAPLTTDDIGRKIVSAGFIPNGTTISNVSGNTVTLSQAATASGTQKPFQVDRPERYYSTALYGCVDPSTGLVYLAFTDPGLDPAGVAYRYSLFMGSIYGGPLVLLGNMTGGAILVDVKAGYVHAGANRLRVLTDAAY